MVGIRRAGRYKESWVYIRDVFAVGTCLEEYQIVMVVHAVA